MKKKIISLFIVFGATLLTITAQTLVSGVPVNLQVCIEDPTPAMGGIPRGPVSVPTVTIDDHTLYFYGVGYDFTLQLLGDDDNVVYSIFVPVGTVSIALPSTISGDYVLQLIPGGSYYFEGTVAL